jgi:trans-feruloyl-CoA hydratase/vanillin synthase
VRNVRTMDIPQALEYLATKSIAMQVGDKDNSYRSGLSQFLDDKSYKPAHGPFDLQRDRTQGGG